MSFRSRKREIEATAKNNLEKIEQKKRYLNRVSGKNVFEEVNVQKKFWVLVYSKMGLKMAPAITFVFWVFSISFRSIQMSVTETTKIESIIINLWRLKITIMDWTIRKNRKPREAIGNYVFTAVWKMADRSRSL